MAKLLGWLASFALAAGIPAAPAYAQVAEAAPPSALAECIANDTCPAPAEVEAPHPCQQGGCGIDGKKRKGRSSSFAGRSKKTSWSGRRSQHRSVFKAGSKKKGGKSRWRRGKAYRKKR